MPSSDEALPDPPAGEVSLADALAYASKLHQAGQLGAAEEVYRRVLSVAPDQPDALHWSGLLAFQRDQMEDAVALIRRAIAVNPEHADAHNNLGNVLQKMNRHEEALAAYERAAALRPDFVDAHYNQGVALESLSRLDECLTAFRRAITLTPFHVGSYRRLGAALYASNRIAEAQEIYTKWVSIEPTSELARHMLASCTGGEAPPRTPDGAVQDLFEHFADSFDNVLARLKYQAPAIVAYTVEQLLGPGQAKLDVLDAGCGTGLCGPLVRPYAKRLVGVDLSRPMLEKAHDRKVYDDLVCGELTAFLDAGASAWDLVVSADTLVYFGDLAPVMAAAARTLRSAGLLVFTTERAEPSEAPGGHRINPSGRYSHTEPYLREVVTAAGLVPVAVGEVHLRVELNKPVDGYAVAARKR